MPFEAAEEDEPQLEGLSEEQLKAARKNYVPLDRLNEATGKIRSENEALRRDLARLEGTVSALAPGAKPPQEAPKEYSRAQLREFVSAGQITQEQADEYWDQQQDAKWERKLEDRVSKVREETQVSTSQQSLTATVARYSELMPDLLEDGSENRTKVSREYQRLARIMGAPKANSSEDFKLQVAALEAVFGPVEKVESRRRRTSQQEDLETMADGTTGDEEGTKTAAPRTGAIGKLSAEKKAYYQKQIEAGRYADWDDVKAELNFTRKKSSRR